mgnify:CR=1 FL=1
MRIQLKKSNWDNYSFDLILACGAICDGYNINEKLYKTKSACLIGARSIARTYQEGNIICTKCQKLIKDH